MDNKSVTIFPNVPVWAEDAEGKKIWASTTDLQVDNKDLEGRRSIEIDVGEL